MKRLIFLDIDGCMASYSYLMSGKGYVDPQKSAMIETLCERTGAKIVISSSWGEYEGKKALVAAGIKEERVIGAIEPLERDCPWLTRGNSIEKWLCRNINKDEAFSYVIIDDNADFLMSQEEFFVQTNPNEGITERDIEKAEEILFY